MLTRTQEQILIFLLANQDKKFSIRGIARKLNKSYTLVYNSLSDLEKKEIVKKLNVPPAQIVTLNEFVSSDILIALEFRRKNNFLEKYLWVKIMFDDILDSVENIFFIFIIFGSYAKEKAMPSSDIDLLVIVNKREDIKNMENVISRVRTKVKKSLNVIELKDFQEMIRNSEELNIGNEARKNHIILYGAEEYYQILKRVYKK